MITPAVLTLQAPAGAPAAAKRARQTCARAHLGASAPQQRRQMVGLQRRCSQQQRAVQTAAKAANIVEVNAEGLEAEIMNRDRPLVIDFYATWCGPCLLLAKELEAVAETMGDRVRILKVDTDANPEISTQLQIQGLPTLIFVGLNKDKPALRTEGLLPATVIQEIVENELEAPAAKK